MATLTVFTPAYNGADTLPRLFASLRAQSSRDFEWLVVDDGSTDATRAVLAECKAAADFDVRCFHQPNSGKHMAHNLAVTQTNTELMLILDADDELLPDAVRTITAEWQGMTPDEREAIAGIWTLAVDPWGRPCGDRFPQPRLDTTLQAMWYRHGRTGERLPCFRTEVLKRYPFPRTEPGECPYIPEAYVWFAITRRYPIRFLDVPCRLYHPGGHLMAMGREEYRLSRCIVYSYAFALGDLEWFKYKPRWFLVNTVQTARYGLHGRRLLAVLRDLGWAGRMLVILALPAAFLLLARDHANGRIRKQMNT